ncbi:rhombosortase [Ideonella livida]|uniref:Rhombosortase n=1 Tax=Ideonella livida TaxID=2707176 RepID=A0A7C9TJE6_9BURK|nr:rhombosortase [Ideonella livida]NDY91961.1 rhombosortase [Ideonella livida]
MTPASARPGRRAWWALCALLATATLLGPLLPPHTLDWEPGRALAQPWRWWSAALVHLSPQHLAMNLLALAALAWWGARARLPAGAAAAWALAWPLTHLGLLLQPALLHYSGLSGVLHAGVAVGAVQLLPRRGRPRTVGLALLAGLFAKLALEGAWRAPTQTEPGLDFALAPGAHLSGALAGVACSALALAWSRARTAPPSRTRP